MSRRSARLLVVDEDSREVERLARLLHQEPYYLQAVGGPGEALERLEDERFDAVFTEYRFSHGDAGSFLADLQRRHPRLPIIVASTASGSDAPIEALKGGAFDFLLKPLDGDEVCKVVAEALAAARLMTTPVEIGGEEAAEQDTLIGRSRVMTAVYKDLGRLSATPVTVLIRGETGTGKELIARALYQHGHRAHKSFVAVNCAAIPEQLLESELFGHERGAFTGAVSTRVGRFEQAHGATLFLDEIGDLDLSLQAKFLRVLQERRIQRVGGRTDIPVDVRVIAATHRNLEQLMAEGRFRADLFYRLNVASIDLPPLRDRPEDIEPLVQYFMRRFGRQLGIARTAMTLEAQRYLEDQPWPGNVRQLQNVVRKAMLMRRGYAIDRPDLVQILREGGLPGEGGDEAGLRDLSRDVIDRVRRGEIEGAYRTAMDKLEHELLGEAMRMSGGNQARAARWLGLSRLTLRKKLALHGLRPGQP